MAGGKGPLNSHLFVCSQAAFGSWVELMDAEAVRMVRVRTAPPRHTGRPSLPAHTAAALGQTIQQPILS